MWLERHARKQLHTVLPNGEDAKAKAELRARQQRLLRRLDIMLELEAAAIKLEQRRPS